MTITTRLYTAVFGRLVGTDPFGNRYYTEKCAPKGRPAKRWVIYRGKAEPSKVPAAWHGWLHYTLPAPLPADASLHMPNLTGTKQAYVPPGSLLGTGVRAPASADYQAWKP